MIVAITGANGFIGKHLVKALSEGSNTSLRLLVRNPSDKKAEPNITEIHGDLSKPETLKEFLIPGCAVINLAYSFSASGDQNIAMIRNLIKACKDAKVKRIIHCSTASVYGRVRLDSVNEESKCYPQSAYGKTKLMIEQILLTESQGEYECVNLRPTEVYGPGGQGLMSLIKNLADGNSIKNYMRACLFGARRMHVVNISNVVAAIIFLMNRNEEVDGETYLISEDSEPYNNYQYIESYCINHLTNRHYLISPLLFPQGVLSLLLKMIGRDVTNPTLNYCSDKLMETGFEYVVSLDSGLEELLSWYQAETRR